jgi:hypothetical protein
MNARSAACRVKTKLRGTHSQTGRYACEQRLFHKLRSAKSAREQLDKARYRR